MCKIVCSIMSLAELNLDWYVEMKEIWKNASERKTVRGIWVEHIKKYVKPEGWTAFWKIPHTRNYELNLKCDTTVGGTVMKINFDELQASILTNPLRQFGVGRLCTVPLIELWPTNDEEIIAKCIEKLRYFYQNLWMPWDDAYERKPQQWCDKYLAVRTAFSDLSKMDFSPDMANYLSGALIESRNVQQKLQSNEPMSDALINTLKIRLGLIAEKFEQLSQPNNIQPFIATMSEGGPSRFVVCEEHETFKHYIKQRCDDFANKNRIYYRPSLQECIEESTAFKHCRIDILSEIENHTIITFQPFSNGAIKGISNWSSYNSSVSNNSASRKADSDIYGDNKPVVICNTEMQFTGDFIIENIKLECRNGLWIRNGVVVIRNCEIIGGGPLLKGTGIRVSNGGKVIVENSTIKCFSVGIYMEGMAEATFSKGIMTKCRHDLACTQKINVTIDKLSKIRKPTLFSNLPNSLDTDATRIIDETSKLFEERLLCVTKNC